MLKLIVLGDEFFDETEETFFTVGDIVVELEHSLVSVSKWESIYQKPFLAVGEKTSEETLGYVRAMFLDDSVDPNVIFRFDKTHLDKINEYIDSKQSATTFGVMPQSGGRGEIITSELIYYWMVAFNIPFECERWHLNRLFSLIRICNLKNSKPRKMSKNELASRNRELNLQRRAALNSKG